MIVKLMPSCVWLVGGQEEMQVAQVHMRGRGGETVLNSLRFSKEC